MKITFASIPIATGPDFGGFDAVTGFSRPEGTQELQWAEGLRASDATPLARGNRKQTLKGTILLAPAADLDDAMISRGMMFTTLPQTGGLLLQTAEQILSYANAVLQSYKTMENANGIAIGYEVVFAVGAPTAIEASEITNIGGAPITNIDGAPITNT
jgi:hypothetical protein